MANLILKPSTGGVLKLQNDAGTVDALTVSTGGDLTAAGTLAVTGATTLSGTVNAPGIQGRLLAVDSYYQSGNSQAAISDSWTRPTGCNYALVYVTGGGGGGCSGQENDMPGSSGGAGGTAIDWVDVTGLAVNGTVAITVGVGGSAYTGAYANNVQAGTGGTSSFGSYCSATGASGGKMNDDSNRSGGFGGQGAGGFINLFGGTGTSGQHDTALANLAGLQGGSSFWSGGGSGGPDDNSSMPTHGNITRNGAGACYHGRHGAGGAGQLGHNSASGGTGGAGVVVVYAYS